MDIDQDQAAALARTMFDDLRPGRWHGIGQQAFVSQDGFATSCFSDVRAIIGFGVLRELTPSITLLSQIDAFNRRANLGHVWVSPRQDELWNLVWSVKLSYDLLGRDGFGNSLGSTFYNYEQIRDFTVGSFPGTEGQIYWPPTADSLEVSAHILLSDLG